MVIAALLAGGSGSRFGGPVPKQFMCFAGAPVLQHSLSAFLSSPLVDAAVVSVPADLRGKAGEIVNALGGEKPVFVIPGGKTRSETLLGVLEFLEQKALLRDSIVLTHDAVRPFVTERMIADNIAAARETGACNTSVPATDTVFLSEDGRLISAVPDRSTVFHAQTPQSFRGEELLALCRAMEPEAFAALTDGCSVYTHAGRPVALVPGDRDNIKITFPEDLETAERIYRRRTAERKNGL